MKKKRKICTDDDDDDSNAYSNGSKYTPGPIQKAEDVVLIKPLEQYYELQILSPSLYRQGNRS